MREKCTRQSVLIVARNAKYRSSLTQTGLFTAESATQREDHPEETDIKLTS